MGGYARPRSLSSWPASTSSGSGTAGSPSTGRSRRARHPGRP